MRARFGGHCARRPEMRRQGLIFVGAGEKAQWRAVPHEERQATWIALGVLLPQETITCVYWCRTRRARYVAHWSPHVFGGRAPGK